MAKVKLGDYIQEYSVKNKNEEDIPVYSVTNTKGFCKDYFGKEVASKNKSTYKMVPRGFFAYNPSRINVGSVDWQREEEKVIVSPLYNVFSVCDGLEPQYLYYYLKSDITLHNIKVAVTGSVRDNLKFSMLCDFPINLPSVDEQRLIVQKIDKVKELIGLRKRQIEKLDALIKARFVEMFRGRGYPERVLSDVCTKITDGTHKTPKYQDSGITFISAKNIIEGRLDFSKVKYINEEEYQTIQRRCGTEKGDVLLSKSGTLGTTALVETDEALGLFESLAILKYDRSLLNGVFLCQQMRSDEVQYQIALNGKGVAVKHLHLNVISRTKIIVPPLDVQEAFASFVAQVDKSKFINIKEIKKGVGL